MIRQNRGIIQQMDNEATVDIETENLKLLCDIENALVAPRKLLALVEATAVLQS